MVSITKAISIFSMERFVVTERNKTLATKKVRFVELIAKRIGVFGGFDIDNAHSFRIGIAAKWNLHADHVNVLGNGFFEALLRDVVSEIAKDDTRVRPAHSRSGEGNRRN
jgi:hypothetical protein